MPIEIRPSDVMAGASRALGGIADAATSIFNAEYEKEKVKQVNDFLITNETLEQKEVEDYQYGRKMIKVYPGTEGAFDATVLPPAAKPIGDASFSDVMKDHAESVKARENHISLTIKNKAAREEALQHLRASDLQQRGRLLAIWHRAAGEVAIAGLNTLADRVKNDQRPVTVEDGISRVMTPEERLAKIGSRVSEMVVAGWISSSDGQKYMQDAEKDIWFTQTLGTALSLATSTETAPEKALENAKASVESSPYYKGKPVEKAELWKRVQSEYKMIADAEDLKKDAVFTELHNNMITVEDGDRALDKLKGTHFYDPMQKFRWHEWLQGERDRIFNSNKLPAGVKSSVEEAQKEYFKGIKGDLAEQQNAGVSLTELRKQAIDARRLGYIDGDQEAQLLDKYSKAADPVFDGGIRLIRAQKGLSPAKRFELENTLDEMWKKNSQWTQADMEQAATNLLEPPTRERLDRLNKNRNMAGQDNTVDILEKINQQFTEGKWTGLAGLPEYKEYLDTYAAVLLEKAHQMFPNEFPEGRTPGSVRGSFIVDSTNGYGRGAGMPILVDSKKNAYSFILEGKNLKLWKAEQAMDPEKAKSVSATKIGEYYWYPVLPAGGAEAEGKLQDAATETERIERHESEEFKILNQYVDRGQPYQKDSHGWFMTGEEAGKRNYVSPERAQELEGMARQ